MDKVALLKDAYNKIKLNSKKGNSKSVNSSQPGIGTQVFEGVATFGRIVAWISLIVGGLISLILIGVGIYFLISKEVHTQTVKALIEEANCSVFDESKYCSLKIKYNVGGKEYNSLIETNRRLYNIGQFIDIRYNPNNPQDITTNSSKKFIGWILFIVGLLILIGVSVNFYLARRSKVYAAATGVGTGIAWITD